MPMSTVCSAATFGEKPPMPRQFRGLAARAAPRAACRARCRCSSTAGVFMSPCASTQSRPSGVRAARARAPRRPPPMPAAEAVIAAEHERQRARRRGSRATPRTAPRTRARSRGCTSCAGRRGSRVSGIGASRGRPCPTTREAEAREPLAEAGDAEAPTGPCRRRAGRAEIERHADDVDRPCSSAVSSPSPDLCHGHRDALARRGDDRREQRPGSLDGVEEVGHLAALVHHVVREEEAAAVQARQAPGRRTACSRASRRRGTRSRTCRAASGSP